MRIQLTSGPSLAFDSISDDNGDAIELGGGSAPVFKTATVTLTNAQIKSLPTDSPITIVPASTGKIILPTLTTFVFTRVGSYTNVVAGSYADPNWDGLDTSVFRGYSLLSPLLTATENAIAAIGQPWQSTRNFIEEGTVIAISIYKEKDIVAIVTNAVTGTIATLTPSGLAVGSGTYDIPIAMAKSNTGFGTGAVFHIVNTAGSYVVTVPTAVSKGKDFAEMDVIVIDGADIGGLTIVNDLTITIDSVATLTEDFTGGDPANTLTITTTYQEVDVP